MGPAAVTVESVVPTTPKPESTREEAETRNGTKVPAPSYQTHRSRRSSKLSWKPTALRNIHHVTLKHYRNVKQSLADFRAADEDNKKQGFSLKRQAKLYARKWTGANEGLFPPRPTVKVLIWSWIAAFCGIALVAALTYNVPWYAPTDAILHEKIHTHLVFMIGSFGASAVLVFGAIDSPLAQPRNLVGGHVFSACCGIAVAEAFASGGLAFPNDHNALIWLQGGLAVAFAIVAMQITRTVHPPGGATALIAVTSPPELRLKGFFIVIPVLAGALILLLVALLINNIRRLYPLYWWAPDVLDVPMEDVTHHTGSGEAFMPHSESHAGVSIHGSRAGGSLYAGGSLHGDSTHHSRRSYIDLSVDASQMGGSQHGGKRPRGEAFAPMRHHIVQIPMHVLQAESAVAPGGGTILEPSIVLDHPHFEKHKPPGGKKLVLPKGGGNAVPAMERVEGWVENDAKGPFERRRSSIRPDWAETEGIGMETEGSRVETDGIGAEKNGTRAETNGIRAEINGYRVETHGTRAELEGLGAAQPDRVAADGVRPEGEGQVHGANLILAKGVNGDA